MLILTFISKKLEQEEETFVRKKKKTCRKLRDVPKKHRGSLSYLPASPCYISITF